MPEFAEHILLLPRTAHPDDVLALVQTKFPDVITNDEGELIVGRYTTISGPEYTSVTDEDADSTDTMLLSGASRPPSPSVHWPVAYVITCPYDRGDAPEPGFSDPHGIYRAFPQGIPERAEERMINLMLAIARRLDGAVLVGDSGVLLVPDPDGAIDMHVWAEYWLDPDDLLTVTQKVVPTAYLTLDGPEWTGPSAEAAIDMARGTDEMTPEQVQELHDFSDQFDHARMNEAQVLDGYAVAINVGDNSEGGVIEVGVDTPEEVDPAVKNVPWINTATRYTIRWIPEDEELLNHEAPPAEFVQLRENIIDTIGSLAGTVADAAHGIIVDADGLLVDKYQLFNNPDDEDGSEPSEA